MDLIYQVREKGTPAMRRFTRGAIAKEAAEGRLAADALVTTEHVDEWYTVTELLGTAPTPQFPFLCPHCRVGIQGRWVDIGGMMTCPACQAETPVPNIRRSMQKKIVRNELDELHRDARTGLWWIAGGVAVTVVGFAVSVYEGWNSYGAFLWPVAVGAGLVHRSMFWRKIVKRKLAILQNPDLPPAPDSSMPSWFITFGAIALVLALFGILCFLGLLPVHEILPHRQ